MGKKSRTKWEERDRGGRFQVNKRQRKKAKAKVKPISWWAQWRPEPVRLSDGLYASVTGPHTVTVSTVQDPNSWMPDDGDIVPDVWIISPSRITPRLLPTIDRGFGRCFSGDQSRRDRFPSPYLPDGKENDAYDQAIAHNYHGFCGNLSLASLMEEIQANGQP